MKQISRKIPCELENSTVPHDVKSNHAVETVDVASVTSVEQSGTVPLAKLPPPTPLADALLAVAVTAPLIVSPN